MKIFLKILMCTVLAIVTMYSIPANDKNIITISSVEAYSTHWHGDPNYPLVRNDTGIAKAVDLSSAVLVRENSKEKVSAVLVYGVVLRYSDLPAKWSTTYYFRATSDGSVKCKTTGESSWRYMETDESYIYQLISNRV